MFTTIRKLISNPELWKNWMKYLKYLSRFPVQLLAVLSAQTAWAGSETRGPVGSGAPGTRTPCMEHRQQQDL